MATDRTRRRLLQSVGVGVLGGLAGCATAVRDIPGANETSTPADAPTNATSTTPATDASGQSETTNETTLRTADVERPTNAVASASIPARPGTHAYATMGSNDAPVTATLYGNWKCPYTRDFVTGQLDDFVTAYVEPGALAIEFRAVAYHPTTGKPYLGPDAPRATEAGLAVWNAAPGSFWSYFAAVFANQPSEHDQWATTDRLVAFMRAADVAHRRQIRRRLQTDAYAAAVAATTTRAKRLGVTTVPRLVVDGEHLAPTVDPAYAARRLERIVDAATTNGSPSNRTVSNGSTTNGSSSPPSTTNGSVANGSVSNGSVANGSTTNSSTASRQS